MIFSPALVALPLLRFVACPPSPSPALARHLPNPLQPASHIIARLAMSTSAPADADHGIPLDGKKRQIVDDSLAVRTYRGYLSPALRFAHTRAGGRRERFLTLPNPFSVRARRSCSAASRRSRPSADPGGPTPGSRTPSRCAAASCVSTFLLFSSLRSFIIRNRFGLGDALPGTRHRRTSMRRSGLECLKRFRSEHAKARVACAVCV